MHSTHENLKTINFPNIATEIICSQIERQREDGVDLTGVMLSDIKGQLLYNVPLKDSNDIYQRLLQSSIFSIDWKFVDDFLIKKIEIENAI